MNLLRVFEAVMQQRSVSGASRELGVTASAVSHALARLRQALDDDLFVPGDGGMEPTARAQELAPGIREGLGRINLAISSRPFVPATAVRTFRIACTDFAATMVLPHLVGRVNRAAPQVDLRFFPFSRMDVVRQLDDGRIDAVVGWFADLPDRMRRAVVMEDQEAVVVRPGHPLLRTGDSPRVSRAQLFAYPHIVVELTGCDDGAADGFIDDRSVSRRVWIERLLLQSGSGDDGLVGRVAVSVPHYAAVPPMLALTDMVATLPRSMAEREASNGTVVILDLPYEPLAVPLEAVWHQRVDGDAGAQWLIGELTAATPPAPSATGGSAASGSDDI